MNPPDQPQTPQAEIKIIGYCRTCGTGLDEANLRTANGTIYCAEHVPTATPPPFTPPSGTPPPYTPASDTQQAPPNFSGSPYSAPNPQYPGDGSPGAAFLLGMIPGVGAIYNGQYAKGMVHVVILALLFMAAGNDNSGSQALFVFLILGFWFYMAFEAYHTARRRRLGLPVDEFSSLGLGAGSRLPVAPILLIGFGTLFLLDNLGILEIRRILKLWPVMMIGVGAYMLYARATSGGDGK
ncbi:MAG: DUF5668 domain-containing protein [Acidobacteriota bacterium]